MGLGVETQLPGDPFPTTALAEVSEEKRKQLSGAAFLHAQRPEGFSGLCCRSPKVFQHNPLGHDMDYVLPCRLKVCQSLWQPPICQFLKPPTLPTDVSKRVRFPPVVGGLGVETQLPGDLSPTIALADGKKRNRYTCPKA